MSRKHQITIPVEILREAGLVIGDRLRVSVVQPGQVLLEKAEDPITEFAGSIPYPEGYLDQLRDEWERDRPIADQWGERAEPDASM